MNKPYLTLLSQCDL